MTISRSFFSLRIVRDDGREVRIMDGCIGRKVRHGRWMRGMPRGQLAKRIGMPIWRLEELEMGNTSIRASCLHQIALALELPVSFFFPVQGRASGVDEGQAEILTTEQALALVHCYYRIPQRQRQTLLHLGDMIDAIGDQSPGSAQGSAQPPSSVCLGTSPPR